ncbi:hypothetical protein [Trabulsiella odontotermitis]|uniref:hypothetical protein n=1 Tax=Trabulsiella odontotermitis TaxID=379893 RepID=UPI0006BA5090|nr:hypothetical protein [Trabulsiella odontotermitis]
MKKVSSTSGFRPKKIAIDVSGNDIVRGIYLWGKNQLTTSKHRINDATIKLSGGSDATLWGFFSLNLNEDTTPVQWDADTIVNNITIKSEGGKDAYMLYQADAKFTGDVILGDKLSYDSVAGTLYSIAGRYGSTLTTLALKDATLNFMPASTLTTLPGNLIFFTAPLAPRAA